MSADLTEERIAEAVKASREVIATARNIGYECLFSADQVEELLDLLDSARSQLAALQSVPQGVEVPKEEWERLKRNHLRRMIDSCPEAETRAWQTFRASDRNLRLGAATPRAEQITKRLGRFVAKCDDALRTSAQDHNETEKET